jgi:presenilin-like A22 family membrane protease
MKHSFRIVSWLILFFVFSQIIGLFVISQYIKVEEVVKIDATTNHTYIINETVALDLPNNIARPEFETSASFIAYLVIAILVTTVLFLFLVRFRTFMLWKLWFFFAVFLCLTVALASFMPQILATILGLVFATWKIFRPNILVHNITEMFIYGGLGAILVPINIVTIPSIIILLLVISAYDAYSVWRSKHMVKMAQFQAQSKVFAGLLVPYKKEKKDEVKKATKGKVIVHGIKTAILGGGDIAFPLMFAGVVLKSLMISNLFIFAFFKTLIVPLFAAIALLLLFVKGREDRFYPALPFLTAGCLVGYGVLFLINLI